MKVSTRIRYACRAMVVLALHEDEGPVALEILATEQCIPEPYLAKIIQDLRRKGLLRSVRGARGGYLLARPASEITVKDVWEALDGPLCIADCITDPSLCKMTDGCGLHVVWTDLKESVDEVLGKYTIAALAHDYKDSRHPLADARASA